MKHRAEGMVGQNSHSQQLLVQEIHMQGSSGAESDQNSTHLFICRRNCLRLHTSTNLYKVKCIKLLNAD